MIHLAVAADSKRCHSRTRHLISERTQHNSLLKNKDSDSVLKGTRIARRLPVGDNTTAFEGDVLTVFAVGGCCYTAVTTGTTREKLAFPMTVPLRQDATTGSFLEKNITDDATKRVSVMEDGAEV